MGSLTARRVVVLEILQDHADEDAPPEWWEALGLSPPWRWDEETEPRKAHVRVLVDREVA